MIANYERELALFAALLHPNSQRRILLFSGESGIGKSTLLRSCVALVPAEIICIPIELRGSAVSVAEIFYRLGGRLGWNSLQHFRHDLLSFDASLAGQVDRNWLAGIRNQITVTLHSRNLLDRSDRIAALTDALFADLDLSPQLIVFAFDAFNNASTEAAEWIAGPFLERVARTQSTRAVVAGQFTPDVNNIEWGMLCDIHRLSGIRNAMAWLPVIDSLKKAIPHDPRLSWLSGVCHALGGNPARIMQVIEALPSKD